MFKKLLGILPLVCLAGFGLQAQCPVASAGPDDTVCVNSTAKLQAILPAGFTGAWTRIGNAPAATITTPANAASTFTGLTTAGTLRLVWTITGTCTARDTVNIVVSAIPTAGGANINSSAGTDRTVCAGGTATLAGTVPAGSTGIWSKAGGINAGSTIISTPASNQSTVTGFTLPSSVTEKDTLTWTVTNKYCAVTVFDKVVITVNAAPTKANGGPDRQKCKGDTIRLIGNTAVSGTPSWAFAAGSTIAAFVPANSGNNDTVVVQGNNGGSVKIAYRIANGSTTGQNPATVLNGCLSVDTVELGFGPANANAGPDQAICESNVSTVTLAATPAGAGQTGEWSFVKKKGNELITNPSSPTSTLTGITSDSLTLRWSLSTGGCTSTDDVNIRISAKPSTANGKEDRIGCANDTLLIIGSNPLVGTPSWATSGAANGITFVPNTAAGRNNDTIRIRLTAAGTYSLVYSIGTVAATGINACVSRDTVKITVNPSPVANAGPDQTSCSSATFGLNGNRPASFASGIWSIIGGTAGKFTSINDTSSTVSGLPAGTSTIRWSVKNTFGCTATNDLNITFSAPPSAANAGADKSGCAGDTLLLKGSIASIGSPSWALATGGTANGITFIPNTNTGRNNDTVRIQLVTAGTYNLVYTIAVGNAANNTACTSRDTVKITVNAAPVANAGPDQTSCTGAVSYTVSGNRPVAPATGLWSISNGGKGTLTAINDTASTVTGLAPGTTILAWTIKNSAGCSASNTVNITVGAAPAVSAGADLSQCVNDTIILHGTVATPGQTPIWTIAGAGNNRPAFIPNGNNDTVHVVVRGTGTYNLIYTVSVGTAGIACTSRDTLSLTVKPSPTATITTAPQLSCKDSTYTVRGNKPVAPATGSWSLEGGTAALLTATDTLATVSRLPIGVTTVKYKITEANGCSASATTTITHNAAPAPANAGVDRFVCLGDTLLLVGSTPTSGTPNWVTVNSTNGFLVGNANNDSVRIRFSGAGIVRLRYRISNGSNVVSTGCTTSDTLVLTASACTGIFAGTAAKDTRLFIHPNPATNSLHLTFSDTEVSVTEMAILTLDGRMVYQEEMGSQREIEKEINVSELTKGMYIVRIKKGNDMEFTKLVIQ